MGSAYWRHVVDGGLQVPADRPLAELTAELTAMLGSPDPGLRHDTARATLTAWIRRGVYDDLLMGLGDGIAAGLEVGLGEDGTDSVFRRSLSALLLGECLHRDNQVQLAPPGKVLEWGDRLAAWYLRENDLRAFVHGKGWAHALAHGADALAALAHSPSVGLGELTVLLDVLADRLLLPTGVALVTGEPERMAAAVLEILRRNVVPVEILEPWVSRLTTAASSGGPEPAPASFNVRAFLGSLYVQLSIGSVHPAVRPDLLLVLVDALRSIRPPGAAGR